MTLLLPPRSFFVGSGISSGTRCLRRIPLHLILVLCFIACKAPEQEPGPGSPLPMAVADDNVRHDTLFVQVTFDLGDGTHLMVASHMEERFEGLRLYRYIARADSSAEILATSSPAYDSWTMLPTFFRDPQDSLSLVLLANLGEKESWGQKVLRLGPSGFDDLAFLDVAFPERVREDGTHILKRRNIAPYVRCLPEQDGLRFSFACDSVHLYDDLHGGLDMMVPAERIHYTWTPAEGLTLWYQGKPRRPAPLSS